MNSFSNRFPITTKYLESLPKGIDSYPQCLARTDARERIRSEFSDVAHGVQLPHILEQFFLGQHKDPWMSEVASNSLQLMLRDRVFKSDQEFLRWCYSGYQGLYKKPQYKMLIYILSTALLLSGAAKRWDSFHKGSTLIPRPIKKKGTIYQGGATLSFPPHLFNKLIIQVQRDAFQAAIDATRSTGSSVRLDEITDTKAVITFSWNA